LGLANVLQCFFAQNIGIAFTGFGKSDQKAVVEFRTAKTLTCPNPPRPPASPPRKPDQRLQCLPASGRTADTLGQRRTASRVPPNGKKRDKLGI
jgi:hypothetical protein